MHVKESEQRKQKNKKQRAKTPRRPMLTPEVIVLYYQCLTGRLNHLTQEDQHLIVQVLNRQFPSLERESQRFSGPPLFERVVNAVLYAALVILTVAAVLLALEVAARGEVNPDVIAAAQTRVVLPEQLAVGRMEAHQKIADNSTLIGKQLFSVYRHLPKEHTEQRLKELEMGERVLYDKLLKR